MAPAALACWKRHPRPARAGITCEKTAIRDDDQ
jgi:hypothetical protein